MTIKKLLRKSVGMTLWAIILCFVGAICLFGFTFAKDYFSKEDFKSACTAGINLLKENGYKTVKDGEGNLVYYDHRQLPIPSEILLTRRCYLDNSNSSGKFIDKGEVSIGADNVTQ